MEVSKTQVAGAGNVPSAPMISSFRPGPIGPKLGMHSPVEPCLRYTGRQLCKCARGSSCSTGQQLARPRRCCTGQRPQPRWLPPPDQTCCPAWRRLAPQLQLLPWTCADTCKRPRPPLLQGGAGQGRPHRATEAHSVTETAHRPFRNATGCLWQVGQRATRATTPSKDSRLSRHTFPTTHQRWLQQCPQPCRRPHQC